MTGSLWDFVFQICGHDQVVWVPGLASTLIEYIYLVAMLTAILDDITTTLNI